MFFSRRSRNFKKRIYENGEQADQLDLVTAANDQPRPSGNLKDFSETQLYKQLRPLLICMQIFGLYFKRATNRKGRPYIEALALYCFVVNFLLVMNVVRSFTVYRTADEFNSVLVQRILFTIWSTECACKGLLIVWNCFKQSRLPRFFCQFENICGRVKLDKMCILIMRKCIILTFVFIIFNSIVFTSFLLYVPVLKNIYLEVVWKNALQHQNHLFFEILLGVLAILNSSSSMFPVSLFVVLSFVIGKQMKKLADDLNTAITDDDFHGRIENFRLRHQNLCELVLLLDCIFAPMIAMIFFANIPMFCLVLYNLVTNSNIHISLVVINLFWLCFILLQLSIVSVTAAWVNVQAHAPLFCIYNIRFSKTSSDVQMQMLLFLNRLTHTEVGFSPITLFVIDKPTILRVAALMFTYFFLLIQFKMPTDNVCHCNLTGSVFLDNSTLLVSELPYS